MIGFIAALDGKLPPKGTGKRILGKVGKAARSFIPSRFNARKSKADLIADEVGAVSGVKKLRGIPRVAMPRNAPQ